MFEFAGECHRRMNLVDSTEKVSTFQPRGENYESVIYVPFIEQWQVGDFE